MDEWGSPLCAATDPSPRLSHGPSRSSEGAPLFLGSTHSLCHGPIPGYLDGKASACNARDPGSISGSGRSPGEGDGNPLQLFLPGESCVWRSLTGYNSWGCTESDTTE